MSAPQMDFVTDTRMHNEGKCDSWNTARAAGMGMAYFTAADMPYYAALTEQVTIGDQYHQSTLTQTNPNRLHLFSGSNGAWGREAALKGAGPATRLPAGRPLTPHHTRHTPARARRPVRGADSVPGQ